MKKKLIRVLSVFLCLLMFLSIIPFTAFATNQTGKMTTDTENLTVSGADGFGTVLSNIASNDEENPDYGIEKFYIVQNNIAYVKYHAKEDCQVVLAVYAEESNQMLASGIQNVLASETEVNVTLDTKSLPQYYILKAFILNKDNYPLGSSQINIEKTKAFEKFDKKTIDDYSDDVVLNFDEQKDENFAVLVDDAKEFTYDNVHNILVSYNESEGIYIFENINSIIRNLVIGDVLTFKKEGAVYLLKVKRIAINGSTATVYEETEYDHSEFFQYIDLDIKSWETNEEMTYIPDNKAEVVGYEKYDEGENYGLNEVSTQGTVINIDESGSLSMEVPRLSTKEENGYLVGDSKSTFSIRGKYDVKLSADASVKCFYDVDWEWKWKFWDQDDYFYFKVEIDAKVKGEVSLTVKAQGDVPLAKLTYVVFGLVIEGDPKLHFEGSVSLSASIEIKQTFGFYYDDDSGFKNLTGLPSVNLYPKAKLTVNFVVSLKFEPKISLVKVIGCGLMTEAGIEVSVVIAELDFKEILNATSVDDIHKCGALDCFEGTMSLFIKVELEGEIFGKQFAKTTLKPKVSVKVPVIGDFYIRTTPSFSFNKGKCPNIAYRCDFTVVNSKGEAIKNLDIESGGTDLSPKYKYNIRNATDDSGNISFFYSKGTYTPSFYINGQKVEVSKLRTKIFNKEIDGCTIQVIDTTKSITVKIDTTLTDGGGSGHNGGTGGSDLFMHNATFNANGGHFSDSTASKVLSIKAGDPITAPSDPIKAGYTFTGWSPEIPEKMPSKDITFTATYGSGNTSYSISGSTLTITGKGDMKNYSGFGEAEWDSKKDSIKKVIINSGITSIGDYAFAQCTNLESVSIPDTVTKIGTAAFYECNSLQSVTLPASVKSVGDYAFYDCYSMSKFAPGSVEKIGIYAFAQCDALKSITLPSATKSIGDSAFAWCDNLKSITISNKNCTVYNDVNTIPDGTTIYAPVGSYAQSYATKYGRNFANITTASINSASTDSLTYSFSSCVSGNDYILLNITGYGNGFELTTSNLEFIDQLTADASGKVSGSFIPRNYYSNSTTLLIGDFGKGIEQKVITAKPENTEKLRSVKIDDTLFLNYKKTAKINPIIDADNDVNKKVEFTSSNNKIATVDQNGNVYGAKKWSKSTATITCTVTDIDTGVSVSDTCNVTVGFAWWQWIIGIVLFGWIWY